MRISYFTHENLTIEARIQILKDSIAFLDNRWPNGAIAVQLRDRKLKQLRHLEASIQGDQDATVD